MYIITTIDQFNNLSTINANELALTRYNRLCCICYNTPTIYLFVDINDIISIQIHGK